MNNRIASLIVASALLLGATQLMAQQQPAAPRQASTGGNSPHETTSAVFDGVRDNRVTISYGRPLSRNPRGGEIRKIWGTLIPWGQPYRLGSDEATLLLTQKDLVIGDATIPAGAYTLYMVPAESGPSKLVFSKKLGGWGVPVDTTQDLVRVDLKKEPLEPQVDQLGIAVQPNPAGGGTIKIMWETTQFSVPFTIKK